jgi:hypothetical protein
LYVKYEFFHENAKCKIMHHNINKPHNPKTSKLETKNIFCDQINLNWNYLIIIDQNIWIILSKQICYNWILFIII